MLQNVAPTRARASIYCETIIVGCRDAKRMAALGGERTLCRCRALKVERGTVMWESE